MKSPVLFLNQIPSVNKVLSVSKSKQALVFCDTFFKKSSLLKKWRDHPKIKFYYLKSGEKTKSLEKLPLHIEKINSLIPDFDKNSTLFIGLGGGSILDLVGFLSVIYKRGLPFVSLPSTWLSVLDSAHGGKNGINFKSSKNLLGSYHTPQAVFVVKKLLKSNPPLLQQSAYGELLKIALIEGGTFYKRLKKEFSKGSKLESFVLQAIQAKMKIVHKDPFEKKRIRQKLNLGHTVGHILEADQKLSHGLAVLKGLRFSLSWSVYKNFLNETMFKEINQLISLSPKVKKISLKKFKSYLRQDKKHRKGFKIDFVFVKKPGEVFVRPVTERELIQEAKRQKIIKNE